MSRCEKHASTLLGAGFYLPLLNTYAYPDPETYLESAVQYDYVYVHAQVECRGLDVCALFKSMQPLPTCCLLESLTGKENGRYSVIASQSLLEIESVFPDTRGLPYLRERLESIRTPSIDLPFFTGGLAGFWSYEAGAQYIGLQPDAPGVSEYYFFLPGEVLVYDRFTSMLTLTIWKPAQSICKETYQEACRRLEELIKQAQQNRVDNYNAAMTAEGNVDHLETEFAANKTREEFMHMVEQAREHIRVGDIFQVVLSQRWHKQSEADPWQVYRELRNLNPSPYMFYFNLPEFVLMGASPEMQVKIQGVTVKTRPIAGTRKITGDEDIDRLMEKELQEDEKEICEHLMLVDLGRNDIGRISRAGSVKLAEFMKLERYSHVVHLVSTVEGTLKESVDAMEAFKACFPAGTLSGAPKRKAMEIIADLEKDVRGPYGGAAGYVSFNGDLDSCISIRGLLYKQGHYYLQSGAGIVADSQPELEYKETLNKARALMLAIKRAEERI